jgi:hypothetical protein
MLLKSIIGLMVGLLLVACGGGATSSFSSAPSPADEYFSNIKNHQSGKKVFSGNVISNGEMREFLAVVNSEDALVFMAEGSGNITGTSIRYVISDGMFQKINWSSGMSNYESVIYLDSSTSEKMYIKGTMLSDTANVVVDGAKLTSIPSGSYTYRGGILNYYSGTDGYSSEGTFSMLVDFNAGTANLTANPGSFNISANDIVVDSISGTFSSNNLLMASPYGGARGTWEGELHGNFTGSEASGVIGVYSSPDTSHAGNWGMWTGAIAGTRK